MTDKEVARLFYMVKGHITDPKTMRDCYSGYFKRMWGNHELCYHEDGFEEAYKKHLRSKHET
jgi:hypothetical protein